MAKGELPAQLPPYTVRSSHRARRMQLNITPLGDVEVVVPRGVDPGLASAFVARHGDWVRRALRRLGRHVDAHACLDALTPTHMHLRALGEYWCVIHAVTLGASSASMDHDARAIEIRGPDAAVRRNVLRHWLRSYAKVRLIPWLEEVSARLGLPYRTATVRAQKTRWGSCSADKRISLNCKLLFLPPKLVEYVFIHELCHTVYLNHSRSYWQLVGRVEAEYGNLEAELRRAESCVPRWAYRGQ